MNYSKVLRRNADSSNLIPLPPTNNINNYIIHKLSYKAIENTKVLKKTNK